VSKARYLKESFADGMNQELEEMLLRQLHFFSISFLEADLLLALCNPTTNLFYTASMAQSLQAADFPCYGCDKLGHSSYVKSNNRSKNL